MQDLVLLKIGGSICTEKAKGEFKVKRSVVKRIGQEISEAKKKKDFRLIVVNGAGPFGHVNVTDYDINEGLHTERDFEGFAKTICDCGYLNWSVADALRESGILALPFPTSSVVVQSKKKITGFSVDVLRKMWDSNPSLVPVMNGTMVPDIAMKGSVISGDAVLEYLAARFRPGILIFATDVDGIFTGDPTKDKKARLIETVTKESFGNMKHALSGSSNVDVTGGMLGKVERLLGLRNNTVIVNGSIPGRVRKAILREPVRGTTISVK